MIAARQFPAQAHPPTTLTVFAAASLTAAFNEIADTLRHRDPGLAVAFNYAGSQALALQIEQGAPADVFASADDHWMTVVKDSGAVKGEPAIFAHNHLVVIVPKANPGHVRTLQDLARPGVKLVLADAAVPVGHYARVTIAALEKVQGFSAGYADNVIARVVSNEDNVKGVVAKVQLGEADAGIVYVSDVTPAVAGAVTQIAIPEAANAVADYPIAVLRRSTSAAAQAFVDLVLSPTGQGVLARNGFIPVRTPH
ncbi:MAG TPA: molybdate ABC transporter substrate-binding protein [Gemmatimonadales bacterium]